MDTGILILLKEKTARCSATVRCMFLACTGRALGDTGLQEGINLLEMPMILAGAAVVATPTTLTILTTIITTITITMAVVATPTTLTIITTIITTITITNGGGGNTDNPDNGGNGGGNNGGGGGGNPDRNPNPNPPPPAVATKLVKISGDDQEGLINTELANPFIVEVHDQNNAAFDGATVTFDITAGGGSLSTTITTTDANGRAESRLTLGPNLGTNTVEVSAVGIPGTETFSAEAVETLTPPTDGNNNGNGNNDGGNNQEPDIPQRTDS